MKESKIILFVFLAFSITVPIEVSGQSIVIIGQDSFEMYSNPLKAKQILHDKVYERIPEGDYIRDMPPYVAWWRLQNDSLFLDRIVDCYSTVCSDNHKTVLMDIEGIFDAYLHDGKIFASWYSGELDVAGGECIYQAGMGFRSDYEDQWIYRVENGRVASKTTYRNKRRETALSGNIVSLIETLFNGDRFPELADKYVIAKVQVIPRPDGSIDSLGLAIRMVADKSSISQVRDDDGQWIENDFSNPYIQELKECVLLVPAWDYVNLIKIYKRFRPKGLEIISFSIDDNKHAWLAAIGEDGCNWKNVSDLKGQHSEIAAEYCVKGIPCTFILDEENRIVAKNLRGRDLEKKIDEMLKKKKK